MVILCSVLSSSSQVRVSQQAGQKYILPRTAKVIAILDMCDVMIIVVITCMVSDCPVALLAMDFLL